MALAPIGVARCYNPAAFSGGTDPETDETLRKRIMDSYARLPNGSNASYYEAEALNTDGVAAAKVIPRARGLGTVDVIVAAAGGSPPPELIAALQEKFAKEREICVDVRVASPVLVPVNISVVVEVEEGSEAKAVCANVAQELGALFDGRLLGRNLNLARIGNVVYGVPGVLNYTISSPGADVSIATNELPVSGSITVTRR